MWLNSSYGFLPSSVRAAYKSFVFEEEAANPHRHSCLSLFFWFMPDTAQLAETLQGARMLNGCEQRRD
jgi:hypothetical protein